MIVWVYDRWGTQVGCLNDVQEFAHSDEVNGVDSVTVIAPNISLPYGREVIKGDRLVWRDKWAEWHEHIVGQLDTIHADGSIYHTIYAENSITELMTDYKDERDSYGFSANIALQRLLEDTRWAVGTVDNFGTGSIKYYHETVYDGLTELVDLFGGEVYTSITVTASGVSTRRVNLVKKRGQDNGLLFTYGYDMDSIAREVSLDDVYTRIHCFGEGLETYDEDGNHSGYSRRLTFAAINGGRDYVEDDTAKLTWGLPGKDGTMKHSEGVFVWEDVDDAEELLKLGRAKLEEVKQPRIEYSATVAVLADIGLDFKNARPGDTCTLRDKPLDARLSGRVTKVVRYYVGEGNTELTIGNITRNIADVIKSQQEGLKYIHSRAASWDGAASSNGNWLNNLMKNLNNAFDVGGSYQGSSFELGSIWCSVPLARDAEGNILPRPSKTVDAEGYPPMAIQITGAGLRIANSLTSTGDFDWRTFGTGRGFTADEINVGTMRADRIRAGLLTDEVGNNFWNFDTGHFKLSPGATIGDKTVDTWVDDGINDFVNNVYDPKIADLQKQIDGQIETWYYDYEPKLTNKPASDWTTENQKVAHEGDLFYWKSKGYAYRFFKDGSTWVWQMVQDTDITKAMAAAAEAQDTADNKRRVFVSQPTPPYDIGDLWVQGSNGDIMRAQVARKAGSYVSTDWVKASKYTDNTALNDFIEGQFADLEDQVDGKIETWAQTNDPSTEWTTAALKTQHKGDLWFNTKTGDSKRWNGTSWEEITAQPPEGVFDLIDGKAQVFITQPKPPYYEGDLWFNGMGSGIMTCITTHTSGSYRPIDWEERNNYVDATSVVEYTHEVVNNQTQEFIFNKLTNNGKIKGIFMEGSALYINADYIKSGTMSADRVRAGVITDEKENNTWDLDNGLLSTNKMTATDMTATRINASGTFYTSSNKGFVYVSEGNVRGGTLDAANTGELDFSYSSNEVRLYASDKLFIQSKGIRHYTGGKTYDCITGGYNLDFVSDITITGTSSLTLSVATINLQHQNGLCTACSVTWKNVAKRG